jgi:ABC-type phosphate transport system substrate-binding protein
MPPELLAQIAEQTYTCEAGNATLQTTAAIEALVSGWQDSLATACTDMTFGLATATESPNIVISASAPDAAVCVPLATVPYAFDAGVVEAYFADGTQVQLSAKSLSQILSKKITDWSDPQLAKDNPNVILPSLAISITPTADANALTAVTSWLTRLDSTFSNTSITASSDTAIDLSTLADGSLTILNYSDAAIFGLTPAAIIAGKNVNSDAVLPSNDTIDSAASQFVVKHVAGSTQISLNPSKKPTPPRGADTAVAPYQAAYPVNLTICGEDSLVNRAVAKYLLRQDSQGAIGSANLVGLPEAIRGEALIDVSKGLPTPKVTPPSN